MDAAKGTSRHQHQQHHSNHVSTSGVSENSPRTEQQQQQHQQQQQQQQQQQDAVPMESPYAPAKRLLEFMPLNMQQVQKSIMEKQALASGTSPTGGLAQRQQTFNESHASTRLTLSIRASSGLSIRHRAAFLGLPGQEDVDAFNWAQDGGSDSDGPGVSRSRVAGGHELELEPSHPESCADSYCVDEVDLSMLPRRHSRMLQQQQLSGKKKKKNRLEEIMKEMMHVNSGVDPASPPSPVKATLRPKSYTTAHLSGVSLCSTALSAIARAERMLVKLHDNSAISLELDSRPASRAQDNQASAKPAEMLKKHVSIMARAGPSSTALHITSQIHAKAKLWGNTTSRPDSPSIAKAFHQPFGGAPPEGGDERHAGAAAAAGGAGAGKPSWHVGPAQAFQAARSRSMLKQTLSIKRSASQRRREGGGRQRGVMQVMSMLMEEEEELGLVGAARRRLQLMERSMLNKQWGEPGRDTNGDNVPEVQQGPEGGAGAAAPADAAGGGQVHAESSEARTEATTTTGFSERHAPPSRDGAMFSGVFGRMTDIRKKMHREKTALMKNNPAAFQEDVAAQAEAEYRAMSERAHSKYNSAVSKLMEPRLVEDFKKAIKQLQSERPYFLPPVFVRDRVERAAVQVSRKEAQPRWLVEQSVFRQRRKEGESRDLYDTDQVTVKQFNLDWQRVAAKVRFRRLVGREDRSVQEDGQRLEEELGEVRQEVFKYRNQLRAMFVYYSCKSAGPMASEHMLNMGLGDWMSFCSEADIVDNSKRGCSLSDLQNVFVAVNFEEETDTQEADANDDDDAMMRFEFYEGIVRSAFGRFITAGNTSDASDATELFIADVILPKMCKEALLQPNDFRRERLYTEQMANLVEDNWDLMFAMYKMYKAKDRTKFFWVEHWAALLESTGLLGACTGLERREAKLIFVWSQLLVTDELKRRKRAVGLMFLDFVEALARVAEFLCPPPLAELLAAAPKPGNAAGQGQGQAQPSKAQDVHPLTEFFKQRSDKKTGPPLSLVAPASCPLHVKFETLMDYLAFTLRAAWGGRDRSECAAKMMRMSMVLGSGIELG